MRAGYYDADHDAFARPFVRSANASRPRQHEWDKAGITDLRYARYAKEVSMRERIKGNTLVARDEGDNANGVVIKLYGEETNGVISIIEQPFEPGFLLPPHVHENDVWLYVLEGEMHARVGDEVVKATPGCWVLKPRRIPHTMWNAGPEPARIIELYTPGGFERFFKDFGDRLRQGPIGLDELNRVGEPHGIRFFDDWIPDLKAAYNLRVIGE
jgi:quercetin dioxygenase-like cupin family protein